MAVGRLVGLASQATLATSSSATVTIPDDGSVAEGDLLIVGCVMPSGSRTFAISGGAGTWNSLGSAAQSGHTSQVWWRIATEGDLGTTVTVTPSTGNIRQVLLLASISGVDQDTPIAASQGATTLNPAKVTPVIEDVPADCRDVSVVWDSRGASTPNTSSWTPPLGVTRVLQAFTTDGSGASSGAMGDSDSTVTEIAGGREWTPDQPAIGSAWTLVIAPGAEPGQTITPERIESTATVYTPTLVPGPVTLTPARIEPTTTVYTPTLVTAGILTPARIESTATVYTPTLEIGRASCRERV